MSFERQLTLIFQQALWCGRQAQGVCFIIT